MAAGLKPTQSQTVYRMMQIRRLDRHTGAMKTGSQ